MLLIHWMPWSGGESTSLLNPCLCRLLLTTAPQFFEPHQNFLGCKWAWPHPPCLTNLPALSCLQYLLAMVLVYFRRANLKLSEYTRSNLFLAL